MAKCTDQHIMNSPSHVSFIVQTRRRISRGRASFPYNLGFYRIDPVIPMPKQPRKQITSAVSSKPAAKSLVSKEAVAKLKMLGNKPTAKPTKSLEVFRNPTEKRDYLIHFQIPEFTCLCPITGQPDFATLYLDYIPGKRCVELKSLKLYIWSFRDEGKFHEAVTNEILDDIVAATSPRFARLTAKFWVRGGVFTTIVAEHRAKGWKPLPAVPVEMIADESSVTGRK